MIDERSDVGSFFRDLPRRFDGWILLIAALACALFAALNLLEYMPAAGVGRTSKWVTLWLMLPIIFTVVHIRLRQQFSRDGVVSKLVHVAVVWGTVLFLFITNMGVK